jgi:hypothetical protein
MKRLLLLSLFAFLANSSYSQRFSNGYFIKNIDEKTECLIRNPGFKSPSSINYMLSENSPMLEASIDSIKEFGIYNESKHIRSLVNIDRSSTDLRSMGFDRNPEFKEELLFLQMLVEGRANLFVYEEAGLVRLFFQIDDLPIEQLIFKEYKTHEGQIGKNNTYRQQLMNRLQCSSFNARTFSELRYDKKDMVKLFTEFNRCTESDYIVWREKRRRGALNISIRPGMNNTLFSISNVISNHQDVDFGRKLNFRQGIEFEFYLPFYERRWSIIVEPTYQYFEYEKTMELASAATDREYTVSVDYQSIELPLTIRHYFGIKNNSKIFVNASAVGDVLFPSSIDYDRSGFALYAPLKISTRINYAFGVGLQHNKYSLEYRYHTNRQVLGSYLGWNTDYRASSIIFGYRILSGKL